MTIFSEPCSVGQYLNQQSGCQDCHADQWSTGGTTSACSSCPDGKGVEEGRGGSEEDCNWSELWRQINFWEFRDIDTKQNIDQY